MDKVGRKGSMMGISVFFALSYLLLACAKNVWMLLIGRFLTGIASGMTTVNYNFTLLLKLIMTTYHFTDICPHLCE